MPHRFLTLKFAGRYHYVVLIGSQVNLMEYHWLSPGFVILNQKGEKNQTTLTKANHITWIISGNQSKTRSDTSNFQVNGVWTTHNICIYVCIFGSYCRSDMIGRDRVNESRAHIARSISLININQWKGLIHVKVNQKDKILSKHDWLWERSASSD